MLEPSFFKVGENLNKTPTALLFRLETARDYRDILSNYTFSVETCKKGASKFGCCVLMIVYKSYSDFKKIRLFIEYLVNKFLEEHATSLVL